MKNKILILGSIPLPIGGVTIHVKRLLDELKQNDFPHSFVNIQKESIFKIIAEVFKYKKIHIHSSNVYFNFLISITAFILRKKTIVTFHGNLGRYNLLKNTLNKITIQLVTIPIVLNQSSFKIASPLNNKTQLISAFIPPISNEKLPLEITKSIEVLKQKFNYFFCTNAFNLSFDKEGNEIYGISMLIDIFNKIKDKALIVSDPSGNYKKHIIENNISINSNIFFITEPHSFYEILKKSDCFLRTTTTDGDALSVKEALWLNTKVIASDCVSRHAACILYKTESQIDLENTILAVNDTISKFPPRESLSGFPNILKTYKSL